MWRNKFFLLVVLSAWGRGFCAEINISTSPIVLTPIENNAFKSGEKLIFQIKYQFVVAGEATLEVYKTSDTKGRAIYQFVSQAKSTSFIDVFFKVRDYNVATVDAVLMASLGFHQNLKEGHYHVIRNTTIDYDAGRYTFEKTRKGTTTKREGEIDEPVLDILSSFFYTRLLPLEPGKDYEMRVFADEKVYSLLVKVHKKVERIKVRAGTFECLRIQPFIIGDSIFKADGGKMLIWLTNDERKMPVLIRSKVMIGAFDAELAEVVLPTP